MSDTFECYAEAKHETPDALLCELETGDEVWVPKSVIQPGSDIHAKHDKGDLVLPMWFARDRELD